MLDKYLKFMLEGGGLDMCMYPVLLRSYVVDTPVSELLTFICEIKGKIYLTPRGQEEVDVYLSMVKRPANKRSFSRYVKVFYTLQLPPQNLVIKTDILTAVHADSLGMVSLYFKGQDYLGFFPETIETREEYVIKYSGDYEEFVCTHFPKKEIARKYLNWLETKIDLYDGDLFYDVESYQMAKKSLSQRSEYTAVMDSNDLIYIVSDGLGVFSAMAILRDIDYVSNEPNPIGNKALKLGLITTREVEYVPTRLYVYMYCVKYYELPAYPSQKFLVIDVPTTTKPGFNENLFVSKSHKTIKYEYIYPYTVMSLASCHCLDYTSQQVTSVMKVPHLPPIKAQFIIASSGSSLESAISSGFFSSQYWRIRFISLSKHDQARFTSSEKLLEHIKNKTLLLFDRSFPFRHNTGSAIRVEKNVLKRDYGPGWYFIENAMWYGNSFSPGDLRVDYTYDSGYFIFKDSTKPKNILFVSLFPVLQDIYGVLNLKLCLVSIYRVGIITYLTYAPEVKILKKPILIDDV